MLIRFFISLLIAYSFHISIANADYNGCYDPDSFPAANVNFIISGTISVPQNAPVGTVIYEDKITAEPTVTITCDGGFDFMNKLVVGNASGINTGGSSIYSTNIIGVGYSFALDSFDANPTYNGFNNTYAYVSYGGARYWTFSGYVLRLVVTNNKIGAGQLTPGLYGQRQIDQQRDTYANIYINGGNIVSVCSVKDDNVSVPMGTVYDSEFTGPGSNSTEVKFKVAVNCPANSNVYVTMGGTADSDMTDGSVLALTPGEGNATGIGAQILYNGTPLKLNEKLFMKKAAGGDESLQFSARYIQTKPSITPGHANATGTLTITYE